MKLSDHFDSSEIACKCGCGLNAISPLLIECLERVRIYYGLPVHITSGCRCQAYNNKVGGALNSQHMKGLAADFWITEIHPFQVYDLLNEWYPNKYGIGRYYTFTHFDVRGYRARWGV